MSDDAVREKLRLYADDVAPAQLPSFGGVTARRRRRRTQQLLSATSAVVVVALVVVFAVVLGRSTGTQASGLGSELAGGKWSLASITTSGVAWKAPADNGFSLSFTSSGYTGNDSCNGTSGNVSYGHDTVHLGSGAMTEIGCLGADQARMQDAFRLLIDKDLPAVVSGQTLTITAGQTLFVLSRLKPAVPVDLSKVLPGTTWDLISIGATGKEVSSSTPISADLRVSIAFRAKDYVATDGCNGHSGSVTYAASAVTFTSGLTTSKRCNGPTGAIAMSYARILTGTVAPTLVGDTLTIANATDSLVFSRETPDVLASRLATALTSHEWKLTAVAHAGSTETVPATQKADLFFLPDRYSGGDGCNTRMGLASYGVTTVTLSAPEETKTNEALCPGLTVTDVPLAFRTVLAGALTPALNGDQLVLSARGYALTFTAGAATPSAPVPSVAVAPATSATSGMKRTLIASTWKLETLKTATDSWHAIEGSAATLTFTDSAYQVSDGCVGEGHAVVYDDVAATLTIDRTGESMGVACSLAVEPPKGSVPPQAYADAFAGTLHVTLAGNTLTLTRTGVVLTFSRQAPEPQPTYPAVTSDPAGKALQKALTSSTWRLESFGGNAAPSGATVVFGAHGFVANDGTNVHDGAVSYLGGRLVMRLVSASGVGSAGQASPSITALAGVYDTMFSGVVSADLSFGGLRLSAGGVQLILSPDPPPAVALALDLPAPTGAASVDANTVNLEQLVAGRRWMLSALTVKGSPVPKASTYGAYLTFSGAGFHLDDGCNEGDGPASYSGQTMTFGSHGMSAALCVPSGQVNGPLDPGDQETYRQQDIGFQDLSYDAVVLGPRLILTSPDRVFTYLAAGSAGAPLSTGK